MRNLRRAGVVIKAITKSALKMPWDPQNKIITHESYFGYGKQTKLKSTAVVLRVKMVMEVRTVQNFDVSVLIKARAGETANLRCAPVRNQVGWNYCGRF